jgi:hypothetical protein
MSAELTKVDSAVQGLSISPKESKIVKPPKADKPAKDKADKPAKDKDAKPAKGGKDAKAAGGKAAPAAKEPQEVMNVNELRKSSLPLKIVSQGPRCQC